MRSVLAVATCTLAVACGCGDTNGAAATHSLAIETEAAPVTLPGTAQIAFGRDEVAVAHTGDGAFSVFWVERRPTSPSSAVTAIREHRFDRSGALVDPDARELVPPAEDVRHASLATCSGDDGRAALVWAENLVFSDSTPDGLYVDLSDAKLQRFDDGEPVGGIVQAETSDVGSAGTPAVGCLAGGSTVAVWQTDCEAREVHDGVADFAFPEECRGMPLHPVYAQVFDADGAPDRANVRVDEDAVSAERLLSVAATPDGGFLIVTNQSSVGGIVRAYADGGELHSVRTLSGLDVGSFVSAPAACVRAGSCVLFWNNFRTAIAFVSDSPTFEDSEQTVLAQHFGRDTPTDVDLVCDPSGICLFTWMVLRESDGFVLEGVKVLARALDVESGTFGPKLQLVDLPPDLNGGAHVETLGERRFAIVLRRDDGILVQRVRVE